MEKLVNAYHWASFDGNGFASEGSLVPVVLISDLLGERTLCM